LKKELAALADQDRAVGVARFFRSGKGQYGEGDRFLGISVPDQRKVALRYRHLSLPDVEKLLASPIHEHRFTALKILVAQFEQSDEERRQCIFDFYLAHTSRINNWDLVDTSAPYLCGKHLLSHPRDILYRLAGSANLWERRIAIVSTMAFIRDGDLKDAFRISELLLKDSHDLIHKAVGWMLREAGKRSPDELRSFLERNYTRMPRTTLRYAIERMSESDRKRVLSGVFG
jgi:3-methyladenine DNA glycosylase AlkD